MFLNVERQLHVSATTCSNHQALQEGRQKGNNSNTSVVVDLKPFQYVVPLKYNIKIKKYKIYKFQLQTLCVLYIGQAFRYSPENAFYMFNQQKHFIMILA